MENEKRQLFKVLGYMSLFLALCISLFLFYKYFSSNKNGGSNNGNGNTDIIVNKIKIEFLDKEYEIDENYSYNTSNDGRYDTLNIYNDVELWCASIIVQNKNDFNYDPFNDYDKFMNDVSKNLRTIKKNMLSEYNRTKMISIEYFDNNSKSIIAYIDSDDGKMYNVIFNRTDGVYDYDSLMKIVDILISGKKVAK